MRISDSQRLLFVHVQKTGGNTIEEILQEALTDLRIHPRARHHSLAEILRAEPELSAYWIFSFVRNPWARMVSWWSMIQDAARAAADGDPLAVGWMKRRHFWARVAEYADFEEFVTRGPQEYPRLGTPQIDYLTTPMRKVDWVGRTENFATDARLLLKRLGLPADHKLPHENKSPHGSYQDYYDQATRDQVGTMFARDITEFGYTF